MMTTQCSFDGANIRDLPTERTERVGEWILLASGTEFYVLDPRSEDIHLEDIAHNLSNCCRYSGSCREHYSVAQHSLYVAHLLRHEAILTQLQALFHDAAEAYLSDLHPQVKAAVGGFKELERRLWTEICRRFQFPEAMPPIIKAADTACVLPELEQLFPPHCHPGLDRDLIEVQGRFPQLVQEAKKLKIKTGERKQVEAEFLQTAKEKLRIWKSGGR
jgi:hypothetical protein